MGQEPIGVAPRPEFCFIDDSQNHLPMGSWPIDDFIQKRIFKLIYLQPKIITSILITMKTFLLAIILAVSISNCNGQTYNNFVNEGTNWVYHIDYITPKLLGYEVSSDTIIDNKAYHKFLENEIDYKIDYLSPPYEVNKSSLIGVIREDTLLKQVYMRLFNGYDSLCQDPTSEFLLYDFNLVIGDTLKSSCFYDGDCLSQSRVLNIINVEIFNKTRKYFQLYDGSSFIESIGFQTFFFESHSGCASVYLLHELVYFCEENNCDFLSAVEDLNNDQVKIFPNPIDLNGIINIETEEPMHRVSIFNSNGQIVEEIRNINTKKFEIEQIGLLSRSLLFKNLY